MKKRFFRRITAFLIAAAMLSALCSAVLLQDPFAEMTGTEAFLLTAASQDTVPVEDREEETASLFPTVSENRQPASDETESGAVRQGDSAGRQLHVLRNLRQIPRGSYAERKFSSEILRVASGIFSTGRYRNDLFIIEYIHSTDDYQT